MNLFHTHGILRFAHYFYYQHGGNNITSMVSGVFFLVVTGIVAQIRGIVCFYYLFGYVSLLIVQMKRYFSQVLILPIEE
jgi:hypothetical protein